MTLTFKEVSEIMKIIDASDCEEVLLELEGIKLVVRRGSSETTLAAPLPASIASPQIAVPPTTAQVQSAQQPVSTASNDVTTGTQIRAPMVGSFYRRPSPDQPSFVEIGTHVNVGDPLCLIEVMKLYTTITATIAGTIKHLAVEDTQLVEFDQLLFVIEPD
ncbi:MAG: acetyl-CoA carboxylase biotin carboxyl carrier protein [Hyphomicrobiaceae bacterium]|jgi:acetyl-CoA carboxylase biotin carboxyl carrier protein